MDGLTQRKNKEKAETVQEETHDGGLKDKLMPEGTQASKLVSSASFRGKEREKWEKMITNVSDMAPPKAVPALKAMAPVFSFLVVLAEVLIPVMLNAAAVASAIIAVMPLDLMYICCGLILCFFGGMYPTTMAALEAWRQAGGKQALVYIRDLYEEFGAVAKASSKDDQIDADGDGVADVTQISGKELVLRKTKIALTVMDPDKFNGALQGLYAGWIGVVAVLKVQFAKTIALGSAIGDFMFKTVEKPLSAIFVHLLPAEYHKWIPVVIGYICKTIAISIAWYIQTILSAFHSAIRGGLMAARGLLRWLSDKSFIKIDPDDSYVDEVLGWSLAALGFYVQFRLGFSPPWYIEIFLWPLYFVESWIVWTISGSAPGQA